MAQEDSRSPQQSQETIGVDIDRLGTDLSTVITSLQSSIDQMRQAAHQEIERLKADHRAEVDRLTKETDQLRNMCEKQNETLRSVHGHFSSLLQDYRTDLETRVHQADIARSQMDRLEEAMGMLESTNFTDENAQEVVSAQEGSPDAKAYKPGETTRIAIVGVNSVSAMMRARRALENLESIQEIENRYVAEGTFYLSVRTSESTETLARELTSLSDPPLTLIKADERSVELEM